MKSSEIVFTKYKKIYFIEFKAMVFDLYNEDNYGERISLQKIKNTISKLSDKLERGNIYIFLMEKTVIGYAIIIFYWSNEYGGEILFIDELYVKPDWRGKGVASSFIRFLEYNKDIDIKAMQLEVTKLNKKALRFYLKNGFIINSNKSLIKKL